MPLAPIPVPSHCLLCICLSGLLFVLPVHLPAELDPQTGTFTYALRAGIDDILAQTALYLIQQNRREGSTYTSREFETGIAGYQLRFFDNGNKNVDSEDWISVRQYRIPAEPDTTLPAGYYKNTYVEYVDVGLDGMDNQDYYFINGRRFDLRDQKGDALKQYQVQIESGISAFVQKTGYDTIQKALGRSVETSIKKNTAFDDGSLPSRIVLGVDLTYVFRPITRSNRQLDQSEMIREIRQKIGFIYSATLAYTDISGYRFRDIGDQALLLQRTYDPAETRMVSLIIDALFDTDGDGIITAENLENGYVKFREIHQQLTETARGMNRRIVLPDEKLARLRQEYETLHNREFKP
ncbi:MAG: hypothetical protein O2954_17560 [bacterium]|nr:hypothetical protein [bacterium]